METINKGTIEKLIVPHLSKGKRGFKSKMPVFQVVEAIFYRLKTGCQWRELPLKQFTDTVAMSWESVYYYFNKWGKDGSWRSVWIALLRSKHALLDLSSVQLDGSHIKELFTELCEVLKEANIDSKDIFLNADPGFDSKELRSACIEKEIEANIKPNPRNEEKDKEQDLYFDEELYKRRTVTRACQCLDGRV